MDDANVCVTLHEASRSMDLARIAAGRSDWTMLELALRQVQECSSQLLREMTDAATAPPSGRMVSTKAARRAGTSRPSPGAQPASPGT